MAGIKIQKPKLAHGLPAEPFEVKEELYYDRMTIKDYSIFGENIHRITFDEVLFQNVVFEEVLFKNIELTDCIFDHCDLSNADFSEGSIHRVEFKNSKMLGTNFSDSSHLAMSDLIYVKVI